MLVQHAIDVQPTSGGASQGIIDSRSIYGERVSESEYLTFNDLHGGQNKVFPVLLLLCPGSPTPIAPGI